MNVLIPFLLIGWMIPTALPVEVHPYHVSKAEVDYKPELQSMQIALHLFIEDLELALQQRGQNELRIGTSFEATNSDGYILNYLKDNFKFKTSTKILEYQWLGKELSDDLMGIWCYLEITNTPKPLPKLRIENSIFIELFDDQQNIMNFLLPEDESGYLLFQKGNTEQEIKLL